MGVGFTDALDSLHFLEEKRHRIVPVKKSYGNKDFFGSLHKVFSLFKTISTEKLR